MKYVKIPVDMRQRIERDKPMKQTIKLFVHHEETIEYRESYHELIEKQKDKFIIQCKSFIRTSFEYREYINYLKHTVDMDKCSVFPMACQVNNDNLKKRKISIELHHEPFTLHDLVIIAINYLLNTKENDIIDVNDVTDVVMFWHYEMLIGLVPLSVTVHELVHYCNENPESPIRIFVPTNKVKGKINTFFKTYQEFMPNDIIQKVLYKQSRTEDMLELGKLKTKFTYIERGGFLVPQYESELLFKDVA